MKRFLSTRSVWTCLAAVTLVTLPRVTATAGPPASKVVVAQPSGTKGAWGDKVVGVRPSGTKGAWGDKVVGVRPSGTKGAWGDKVVGVRPSGTKGAWGDKVVGVRPSGTKGAWGDRVVGAVPRDKIVDAVPGDKIVDAVPGVKIVDAVPSNPGGGGGGKSGGGGGKSGGGGGKQGNPGGVIPFPVPFPVPSGGGSFPAAYPYRAAGYPAYVEPYDLAGKGYVVPANPAPKAPKKAGLAIVNPAENDVTLQFAVDGEAKSLAAGFRMELSASQTRVIEFDRGGSFGQARYSMDEGLYTFNETEQGWELYRSAYVPAETE